MVTVVRPFIDRYGLGGILELALFIYLMSFLLVSVSFYFLIFRHFSEPMPMRETHRYALRFSLIALLVYLLWSDRLWPLLSSGWDFLNLIYRWLSQFKWPNS